MGIQDFPEEEESKNVRVDNSKDLRTDSQVKEERMHRKQ